MEKEILDERTQKWIEEIGSKSCNSMYIISQTEYEFWDSIHVRCVLVKNDGKPAQICVLVYMNAKIFVKHFSLLVEEICVHLDITERLVKGIK